MLRSALWSSLLKGWAHTSAAGSDVTAFLVPKSLDGLIALFHFLHNIPVRSMFFI